MLFNIRLINLVALAALGTHHAQGVPLTATRPSNPSMPTARPLNATSPTNSSVNGSYTRVGPGVAQVGHANLPVGQSARGPMDKKTDVTTTSKASPVSMVCMPADQVPGSAAGNKQGTNSASSGSSRPPSESNSGSTQQGYSATGGHGKTGPGSERGTGSSSQTPLVLQPAVEKGEDLSRLENLKPKTSINLFNAEVYDPNKRTPHSAVAWVKVSEMNTPAVALEKTNRVVRMSCTNSQIKVVFDGPEAFEAAISAWSAHSGPWTLIVFESECGNSKTTGERSYLQVHKVSGDEHNLTITCSIIHVPIQEAVGHHTPITVELGQFSPGGPSGFSSGDFKSGPNNSTMTNSTRPSPPGSGSMGKPHSNSTTMASNSSSKSLDDPNDFDRRLDDAIGYGDLSDPNFLRQLLPDVQDLPQYSTEEIEANASGLRRRSLKKRLVGRLVGGLARAARSGLSKLPGGKQVVQVIDRVGAVATAGIKKAAQVADSLIPERLRSVQPISKTLNLDPLVGDIDTPFGEKGRQVFQRQNRAKTGDITIYCVRCGIDGQLTATGILTFSFAKGISKGSLNVGGRVGVGLALGIVASYEDTFTYERQLAALPLSPLSIPGVITLGPQLAVSAGGDLTVQAQGQLLAGLRLDFDNLGVNLDLVDRSRSSTSGLDPRRTPIFQAQGSVAVTAEAFLRASLEFAIDVLNGKFKLAAGINERPSVFISGKYEGSTDPEQQPECNGVSVEAGLRNRLYLSATGLSDFDLSDVRFTGIKQCIAIPFVSRPPSVDPPISEEGKQEEQDSSPQRLARRQISSGETTSNQTSAPVEDAKPEFDLITSLDGSLLLQTDASGNLLVTPAVDDGGQAPGFDNSLLFESLDRVIVGDSTDRLLHGYVDTIASMGVSRLRVAAVDRIPTTAVLMNLVPVADEDGEKGVLVASTTAEEVLYPVVCVYDAELVKFPKWFLVKDLETGIATLQDEKLIDTLTGGKVEMCEFVSFANGEAIRV